MKDLIKLFLSKVGYKAVIYDNYTLCNFFIMTLEDWVKFSAAFAAIVTAFKGVVEYGNSNKIKRIDLLNSLIADFNNPNMNLAKKMLDDYEIISEIGEVRFHKEKFDEVLRDHKKKSIGDNQTLIEIRDSFDCLFDFLTKLEYLLRLSLISKNEFFYFQYYLDRVFEDESVLDFCETYEYKAVFRLRYIFGYPSSRRVIWRSKSYHIKAWSLRNLH